MKRRLCIGLGALIFFFVARSVRAQDAECNPALFKDYHAHQQSLEITMRLLKSIDEGNFDDFKHSAGGKIVLPIGGLPVDFGLTYEQFDRKRKEILDHYKLDQSRQESLSDLQINFSASSGSAYRACLDAQSQRRSGLQIFAANVDNDIIVLQLSWHNPPKDISSNSVRLSIHGKEEIVTIEPNGDYRFSVTRDPDVTYAVIANGNSYAASMLIPREPPPPPAGEPCSTYESNHLETSACNRSTAPGYFWEVTRKLANYGIRYPDETDPTEPPCDSNNVGLHATTWRWPKDQNTWQTVKMKYTAYNGGQGGDPECRYFGTNGKWTDLPQGYHCGTFEVICKKQP